MRWRGHSCVGEEERGEEGGGGGQRGEHESWREEERTTRRTRRRPGGQAEERRRQVLEACAEEGAWLWHGGCRLTSTDVRAAELRLVESHQRLALVLDLPRELARRRDGERVCTSTGGAAVRERAECSGGAAVRRGQRGGGHAHTSFLPVGARQSSSIVGRRKPIVFPVPVFALAITSCLRQPRRADGNAAAATRGLGEGERERSTL